MSGMSLSQGHRLQQRCSVRLTNSQKLQLKSLQTLEQTLKSPEYPYATRGIEGIRAADEILRNNNAYGVLIGGVAESVYGLRRNPNDLAKHKDVDVYLLHETDYIGNLVGGLDWWLPRTDAKSQRQYAVNHFGVVLGFTLSNAYIDRHPQLVFDAEQRDDDFKPGLLVLDRDDVIELRRTEIQASIDPRVEVDSEAYDSYEAQLDRRIGKGMNKAISSEFKGKLPGGISINPVTLAMKAEIYGLE